MSSFKRCLVDTPILVRLSNSSDVLYSVALHAVSELHLQSVQLCITPQNLIEFRNVATRFEIVVRNACGIIRSLAGREKPKCPQSL